MYMISFDKFLIDLINCGYTLKIETINNSYRQAIVTGKEILGAFCEEHEDVNNQYVNGRFTFDNRKCFDKYSKCPYSYPIPNTQEQFQYILTKMKYLATKEGYIKSNRYNIILEKDYPDNIK